MNRGRTLRTGRAATLGTLLLSGLLGTGCSGGAPYEVGDELDGGTVVDVESDGECSVLTVELPAAWECSDEQLELARTYPYPTYVGDVAPAPAESVSLTPTDCDGLAALRRPALKEAQKQTLDQQRYYVLSDKCLPKTTVRYFEDDQAVSYCAPDPSGGRGGSGGSTASGFPGSAGTGAAVGYQPTVDEDSGASEYSTTNTQVAGVDEADFVKNDSGHVYVLSVDGLHVFDAWPAPETHEIGHLPLPGEPRRLFLAGDKLVVYSKLGSSDFDYGTGSPSDQGCTYGYDCRFSSEGGATMVLVFDVSDPAEPKELRRYEMSGGYVASRRVGPYVYTVVHDGDRAHLPGVDLELEDTSQEEFDAEYESKLKAADDAVDSAPAADFLPSVKRLNASGGDEGAVDACDDALAAEAARGTSFISVMGFDLDTLGEPSRTLVAAKPGFIYASGTSLYLASDGVDGSDGIYSAGTAELDRSTVHKFALDGTRTPYRGSVAIPGHVLNQFSMDELDGVLRVATSSGWVPNPDASSNLVTVGEVSGKLQELGAITGIAPQEDIRSVRFDGTRGFVVTFKKTDPLFVFDLTDPRAPAILGELKIPGFSTYMHPLDEDHLLAIGFDADDQGDFAYFDGIQLQIFDVSVLTNPTLLHKTVIGTRGSASEALTNHLAFNYFPSKSLLALPMTVCEGGDNGVYGDTLTFSGLMVFDVSLETGITERGRMPFVQEADLAADPYYSAGGCGNWWTNSTSAVKRSIFMDDYAIGISDSLYQVSALADLDNVLQSLPLVSQQ